jgi:hypothetical protein
MTRSGAPFHGANGDGKTEYPAASSQTPDAASAGEFAVEKRNKAVAAAVNRLGRSIFTTFLEEPREPHSARPAGPDSRIAALAGISQQI